MRRLLISAALVATLTIPLSGPAGATEVVIPGGQEQCKTVFLPAQGGAGVAVQKKIVLAGAVLNLDVKQEVVRVVKTIAVQVCVGAENNVVVKAEADAGANGIGECPQGAAGAAINVPVNMAAGSEGGVVKARVRVAVSDRDTLLGQEFNKLDVVIDENKRIVVPPNTVEDQDAVNADLCVGPAEIG